MKCICARCRTDAPVAYSVGHFNMNSPLCEACVDEMIACCNTTGHEDSEITGGYCLAGEPAYIIECSLCGYREITL